jgi:peptidyl-dipeptidase Dcp
MRFSIFSLSLLPLKKIIMKKLSFIIVSFLVLMVSCDNDTKTETTNVSDNPLLQTFNTPFGVPPFDKIKPSDFPSAFDEGMKKQNEEIAVIANSTEAPTFSNTIEAYMNSGELINSVSSIFTNLNSSNTNDELQKINEDISPKMAAHKDNITLNAKLFERIKSVYDHKEKWNLNEEQSFLLENIYKTFVRNGALLPADKQEELKKINQDLSSQIVKFDQNILAETNDFKLIIDKKEDLAGLPDAVIAAAAETAQKDSLSGKWIFTTSKASMIPFLQYAQNRSLREKIYKAYTNRGNNNNANDNKAILAQIVILRSQKANLLGYPDYASYKLEDRMAKTPDKVFELLNRLWVPSIKVAKNEVKELQSIIDKEGGKFKLEAWDWGYYAEKLHVEKYNIDEGALKPYFKLENVREGAFTVANKLYGLTFEPIKDIPLPHPDATAFEVKEANGNHLGVLYMDFFPRESKEGGAWCDSYRSYHLKNGKPVTPVATVVCNFTKPTKDLPSLLTMDETETLFHEFGHALEGLMCKNSYPISFVAQDFVELPSQLNEHWAFNEEVLKLYAKNYKTGEIIPDDLIQKIKKGGLFNQGFITTEYLAASLLDMAYHTQKDIKEIDIEKFEKDYFNKIGLIPEIDSRYRSTYFGHITGGYDAGYYGYIWSAVLDNDAFEAFKEKGIFNKETAAKYRKCILEKDGTVDPVKMYTNFRGREAKIEPLLKSRGLL